MPRDDAKRDDGGRFVQAVDEEDVLEAMEPLEPYGTSEIAEMVGVTRRAANNYLDQLADDGEITKKKPNKTTAIWIRSE